MFSDTNGKSIFQFNLWEIMWLFCVVLFNFQSVIYLAMLLKSIFVDFFKEKRELRQSLTKKQEIYFTG